MKLITFGYHLLVGLALVICGACSSQPEYVRVQGWNILSSDRERALETIAAAGQYNINHLQLSHQILMNLREARDSVKRELVEELATKAHESGIKEVVVWDHTLYGMVYYPQELKTGAGETLDLDSPAFWEWFRNDYREMLGLLPSVDGIVLTISEGGGKIERQHSPSGKSSVEKVAAVIDAIADVVCGEFKKKLYVRTYSYTDAEYRTTIEALERVRNRDIILMMKETPHDFFLTHPNDKYAGLIARPTIIEFDTSNEFNGQGIIANTWPEYVIGRWSQYARRPYVVGYVARTDRYGNTQLVGTPNEILLDALKSYTADSTTTAERVYDEFITRKYGAASVEYLKPAFKMAYDIVTSSLYTLGTNTTNHSSMNYDPYESSYVRHVPGKWLDPPVAYLKHDVDKNMHYWKDIVEHLAPARFKVPEGMLLTDMPCAIDSGWVTPQECMNEEYLRYVMAEKNYGSRQAEKALLLIRQSKAVLPEDDYITLFRLFERTLFTARLHEAVATAYWGYRIYARGPEYRTPWLRSVIEEAFAYIHQASETIDQYDYKVPSGQWRWKKDTDAAKKYYELMTKGWPEYDNCKFP